MTCIEILGVDLRRLCALQRHPDEERGFRAENYEYFVAAAGVRKRVIIAQATETTTRQLINIITVESGSAAM
jgi:hypothetical protein